MRLLRGELHRAVTEFGHAAQTLGLHIETFGPAYCFGLGDLRREWNQLDEAQRLLERGAAQISQTAVVYAHVAVPGYIAFARLRAARGDGAGALAALDECVALARQRQFAAPVFATLAAARAHIWLQQGNLAAASHWAGTSGLSPADALDYLREQEYLVLARVLGARKDPAALGLLRRLLADAEAHGRGHSTIEILAVRAVVQTVMGCPAEGLADLARTLALAEPEGYIRAFVDEGAPMASLLRRAHAAGMAPGYVVRLLAAFREGSPPSGPEPTVLEGRPSGPARTGDPLVEPLTAREGEILRLLAAGASNRDIAAKLFVSTSTVKGHVHHIIGKLGVKARTQAIAKAHALKLL
jgi:LuxR family maltose regulon positive regulatory protein